MCECGWPCEKTKILFNKQKRKIWSNADCYHLLLSLPDLTAAPNGLYLVGVHCFAWLVFVPMYPHREWAKFIPFIIETFANCPNGCTLQIGTEHPYRLWPKIGDQNNIKNKMIYRFETSFSFRFQWKCNFFHQSNIYLHFYRFHGL